MSSTCNTTRFILYARKSSEDDERQVQSIPDQQSVLEALAKQLKIQISFRFEEARSAKAPGLRPIFNKVLELVERGQADGILCWNFNRLVRNPVEEGRLRWLLQQGQLKAIQTYDRLYLPSDSALLLAVEGGFANQYILDLSKNVKRALSEKVKRGVWPTKAPPGYRNVTKKIGGIEVKTVEPDPTGFLLVRKAWDLMLTGAYTVPEIREKLDEWGFKMKKSKKLGGGPILRSTLYNCFSNPFYYGWFRYNRELTRGIHRPMITKDEFDTVQRILHRGVEQPGSAKKHEFAFTGLMRCGHCGCQVTAERKIKRYPMTRRVCVYTYYHCTGNRGCPKKSITEPEIEDHLRHALTLLTFDAETVQLIETILTRENQERPETINAQIASHTQQLKQANQKLTGLLDMRLNGELSPEEFIARKNVLQEEITDHQEQLDNLKQRNERGKAEAGKLCDFLATAYDRFSADSIKAKRQVALTLGNSYRISDGRLDFRFHPLLEPFLSIEPPQKPRLQVQSGSTMALSPSWLRALEKLRKLIYEDGVTLPPPK